MNMRRTLGTLAAALALTTLTACNPPAAPEPAPAAAPTPTAEPAAPAAEADDGSPDGEQLAVAEDFEAEAAEAIGTANYAAELDALEKEVDSDGAEAPAE